MSLRSVGNQLLQTAPSSLLAGASTASLSLWIRVNPGHQVANANGVEIFGDAGGKLSATLSGTGSLRLQWSSVRANTGGGSSCSLTLALGTSYHLAMVWQDGAQQYYLNGVQVKADTQSGSIGVLGDSAAHPYRLGSDSAGTDASLGDPTLWVGYALSAQDVVNLRDRAVQPSMIAPSSIALRWSLSGPDGVAAQIGDPGLADASPSGLALSTVVGTAPTYQAAALTYVATPPPLRAMVAPSGESFVIRPLDANGNFAEVLSIQSGNDEQSFSPSKATASGSLALTFNGQATAPINYTAHDPAGFALWHNIPATPGVAVDISLTVAQNTASLYERNVFCEVIEGGLVKASANFNQDNIGIGDFQTPNSTALGGAGNTSWKTVFPAYIPATSSLSIRMSAATVSVPSGQHQWFADGLHVRPSGGGAATIYDDSDSAHFSATGADRFQAGGYGEFYNGTFHQFNFGYGQGSTYTIDPAAVQSALQALSSVGAGNVKVTALGGTNTAPIGVEFTGNLGAAAQPALASTNTAVTFGPHTVGGNVPILHVIHKGGATQDVVCKAAWIPALTGLTWAIYPFDGTQTFRFLPSDVITVTIPPNWMATGLGMLPAGTYPVENRFGGTLLPAFNPTPKTMGVGQNVQPDFYYAEAQSHFNFASRCGTDHVGPDGYEKFITWDANGDPTLMFSAAVTNAVSQPSGYEVDGVGGIGVARLPAGRYTIKWDGPTNGIGNIGGPHTNYTLISSNLTGTTDNTLVYNVQPILAESASIWMNFDWVASGPADANGHFPCATKNLRIYPPDPADPTGMTAWTGPAPRFAESFLQKLRSCQSLRFMQAAGVIPNSYADRSQIKPDNWLDRANTTITRRVLVAEIRAYSGAALDNPTHCVIQIKTQKPHGFHTGLQVFLDSCGTATFNNGYPNQVMSIQGGNFGAGVIDVIDATTFAFHAFNSKPTQNVQMTNVVTNTGAVYADIGTAWSLESMVALHNVLKARFPAVPRLFWFNIPLSATDACIDAVATYIAANLSPGIRCLAECGNECWNFSYPTYDFMRIREFQQFGSTDDGYARAYAIVQGRTNKRFQAAFDAAGRSADFYHLFATKSSDTDQTDKILAFASAPTNGDARYRVDGVAIAPYIASYTPYAGPGDPRNFDTARGNLFSVGVCLDVMELNTDDPGINYTAANRATISKYYPAAQIVCYEGGPEHAVPGLRLTQEGLYSNGLALDQAVHRHPRFFGIGLRFLQSLQDFGVALYTNFYAFGASGTAPIYSTYEWDGQLNGTGDPAENPDYRNTSGLTSGGQVPVKSQYGGAIDRWNSLVGATPIPLASRTATPGPTTATTASATATDATGGTSPYTYQWYRSTTSGQAGSAVSGQTTRTLADTGLTAGTTYYYQLKYTDANGSGSSVLSNQVALTTTGGGTTAKAQRIILSGNTSTPTGWSRRPMRRPIR